MAVLPDDTKMLIRLYLGWPARFRQTDSALEQALNYVDTDLTLQAQITGSILPNLQSIDAAIGTGGTGNTALLRLQFSKAGEIETNIYEMPTLRAEGRKWVNRLSTLVAVPVREDVFSQTSGKNTHGRTTSGRWGLRRG